MLSNKEILIPTKLINLARSAKKVKASIISPENNIVMVSTRDATLDSLIEPIFIGNKKIIQKEADKIEWDIKNFDIIEETEDKNKALKGAELASKEEVKILIKGHIHTDILMKAYLKKEFNLIEKKRLSHLWHMTINENDKPLFITDGALNVSPRIDVKIHILKNAIEFAKKTGINKPKVAILSATEDPIKSMPSSIEAKEIAERALDENIDADVVGPLAFDIAVSSEAAKIKGTSNNVAGNADIILVPNLETGNSLVKMMIHFMGACAAGIILGGKVPVVVTSRSDSKSARIASIAAAIVAKTN